MTAPANYDELVGRLEARRPVSLCEAASGKKLVNPDGPEAAAAIRALEGERDGLADVVGELLEAADADRETEAALRTADALLSADEAARQSAEAKLAVAREGLEKIAVRRGPTMKSSLRIAEEYLASLDQMEKAGG